MLDRYLINCCAEGEKLPWGDLLPTLEGVFPVKFILSGQRGVPETVEMVAKEREEPPRHADAGRFSSFRVPLMTPSPESERSDFTVRYSNDPDVPAPFRGRSVRARRTTGPKACPVRNGEKVLASGPRGPVWTVSNEGNGKHYRSGFAVPALRPHRTLAHVVNGGRLPEMVPLLHWLREVCAGTAYDGPPLRACFIFDDPNLHWKRYGLVDFRGIVTRAARENYHVAFAAIPLDFWYTHQATAEVFRRNANLVSLAIHGNNHTKCELARQRTVSERVALLNQAICRVERFERKSGIPVSRVMVPPHGACSEEMLAELAKCGFESACISHGSLGAHNQSREWIKTLGYRPSEVIQGCPVLPRWGLSEDVTNTILLAAFLKQPIILRGHHHDLKDGMELLDDHARIINGLGDVSWSNLTNLSRSNYQWRLEGSTCRLKPIGRTVTFSMPPQATTLILEGSARDSDSSWHLAAADGSVFTARSGECVAPAGVLRGALSIRVVAPPPVRATRMPDRPVGTVLLRRLVTEGRDRSLGSYLRWGEECRRLARAASSVLQPGRLKVS